MTDDLEILLTNDDGIDGPGLRALHDQLAALGEVTVVAPTVNHSGLGRVLSYGRPVPLSVGEATAEMEIGSGDFHYDLPHEERELGYAVEGTPCDCVIVGARALDIDPDVVVSGCNAGPNVGISAFGRSGTVSAAMESAYLDIPGIAVSADRAGDDEYDFEVPTRFGRDLVEYALETDVFEQADYLNAVIPHDDLQGVEVTYPAADYEMGAERNSDTFRVFHTTMQRNFGEADIEGTPGTDRRAVTNGRASVTPMTLPHTHQDVDALSSFAADRS
jgi:5'-nucleotidase